MTHRWRIPLSFLSVAVIAQAYSIDAAATVVNLDEFSIVRSGTAIFDDSFNQNTTLNGGSGTTLSSGTTFSDGTAANYRGNASGLQKIVGTIIPEIDTSELMKRIADIEATIARKRQAIELNTAELFDLPTGPFRDAMKRQLGDAASEIEHHETELEAARKAARMTEHENSHSSIARFRAAKAKLNSADMEERLAARRKLALELRLRIARVELQRDRTMLVRFNDGRGGDNLVELSCRASIARACGA